ncbi:acidic mammalian chitinase-like [Thalassophryne amazonica]|uniref:acidic mammalian chitinase-like n=1 Tax=Thalassophryne amazonica TaxID=390379 RepID=UPI001470BC71|nr:acidic mammalian chitinase-like [Thalassophryne amazonica]
MARLTVLAGLSLLMCLQMASSYKLVCYFTNWSQYRPSIGRFLLNNIDANLCTHLVYAYSKISKTNELAKYEWNDYELYRTFNNLKFRNPHLKTLLAVGGSTFGTEQFTIMSASAANRQTFIQSAIRILRQYDFDGLSLDWAFPGTQGSPPEDKQRYTVLCKEVRAAFEQEAAQTQKSRLLLISAVGARKDIIDKAYEIGELSRVLDFINVMTYDFHGLWEPVTGHNSPLYRSNIDQANSTDLNVDFAMKYWRDNGAPAGKLIVGFATYGRPFRLASAANELGSPAQGLPSLGIYTGNRGYWSYYEICTFLQGAGIHWIEEQKVPYATKGNEWVGFDNKQSFSAKVKYLKENGFGGALVWSLDLDDFYGQLCGQGSYPLIRHVRSLLDPGFPTPPPGVNFCSGKPDGLYVNPNDAHTFYQCSNGYTYIQRCPADLVYNDRCKCCVYKSLPEMPS